MSGGALGGRAANGGAEGGGRAGALGLGSVVPGETFGLRGPALSPSIERSALSSGWSVTSGSAANGAGGSSVGPDGAGGGNTGGSTGGLAGKAQAAGGNTAGGSTGGFAGRGGASGGNTSGGSTGGQTGGNNGGDPGTNTPGTSTAAVAARAARTAAVNVSCDVDTGVCPVKSTVTVASAIAAETVASTTEVAEPAMPSYAVTASPLNDGLGPEAAEAQDAAEVAQ